MRTRRRYIVAASSLATANIAGCLTDEPQGAPSKFANSVTFDPNADDIVARQLVERSTPVGEIDRTVSVIERPDTILLASELTVSPTEAGWKHRSLDEVHDWEAGGVDEPMRQRETNTSRTKVESPPLSVWDRSSATNGRWKITLTPPDQDPARYQFATTVPHAPRSEGDLVAATRTAIEFSQDGWFGDEETVDLELELVYGEIEERD